MRTQHIVTLQPKLQAAPVLSRNSTVPEDPEYAHHLIITVWSTYPPAPPSFPPPIAPQVTQCSTVTHQLNAILVLQGSALGDSTCSFTGPNLLLVSIRFYATTAVQLFQSVFLQQLPLLVTLLRVRDAEFSRAYPSTVH